MRIVWWLPIQNWDDFSNTLLDYGLYAQVHYDQNYLLADPSTKRFTATSVNADIIIIDRELFPIPDDYVEFDPNSARWKIHFWTALKDLLDIAKQNKIVIANTGGMFCWYICTRKGVIPSNITEVDVEFPWGWETVSKVSSWNGAEWSQDIWLIGNRGQRSLYYYVKGVDPQTGFQCTSDYTSKLPFTKKQCHVVNGFICDNTISPNVLELSFTPLVVEKKYGSILGVGKVIRISNPNSYNLTDYQVRIDLTSVAGIPKGTPVAIYDANGNVVPFCYENTETGECSINLIPNQNVVVWLKVSIPASSSIDINVFTGNNLATSPENVFDFYDSFNTGALDLNKWEIIEGDYAFVENSIVLFMAQRNQEFRSKNFTMLNGIIETRWKYKYSGAWNRGGLFLFARIQDNGAAYAANTGGYAYGYEIQYYSSSDRSSCTVLTYQGSHTDVPENVWFRIQFILNGSNLIARFTREDTGETIELQATDSNITSAGKIGIGGWQYEYFDWIRVRKYADQEPTVTLVGDITKEGEIYQAVACISNNPPIALYGIDINNHLDAVLDIIYGITNSSNLGCKLDIIKEIKKNRNLILSKF